MQDQPAMHRRLGRQANTLAIPRIRRQIDDAHDRGLRVKSEWMPLHGEFLNLGVSFGAVFLDEVSEVFNLQHWRGQLTTQGAESTEFYAGTGRRFRSETIR